MEGAKIYAQNAIRAKNQSLNYLKLSARMDAVAARVQTAIDMKLLSKDMKNVTRAMDSIMKTMNIEDISKNMDKFEQQFEDMDLNAQYMEQAMDTSTAQTTPASQVDELMSQIADENGIDLESKLAEVDPLKAKAQANTQANKDTEPDDLEARLAKLQGI